jgi:ActR/RegA family two-component response regulator
MSTVLCAAAGLNLGWMNMIKRTRSILIVGTDQTWIGPLTSTLTSHGHRILIARDSSHPLSILEFRAVDIVIIDLDGLNGDERAILSRARSAIPTPRVILLGRADPGANVYVVDNDVMLFPRPVNVDKLAAYLGTTPQRRSSFSGLVEDVDLLEYFQFIVLGLRKTILEVTSLVGTRGRIYLANGLVLHAALGVLKGEQALYSCLCFKEGTFSHLPWEEPAEVTINKPGEFLLIEAMRRRDEVWSDSGTADMQD